MAAATHRGVMIFQCTPGTYSVHTKQDVYGRFLKLVEPESALLVLILINKEKSHPEMEKNRSACWTSRKYFCTEGYKGSERSPHFPIATVKSSLRRKSQNITEFIHTGTNLNNSAGTYTKVREYNKKSDVSKCDNTVERSTQSRTVSVGLDTQLELQTFHTDCSTCNESFLSNIDCDSHSKIFNNAVSAVEGVKEMFTNLEHATTTESKTEGTKEVQNSVCIDIEENEYDIMLDHIRQTRRNLKTEIHEMQKHIEEVLNDGEIKSSQMAEISNEIGQLKYTAIKEAQEFEQQLFARSKHENKLTDTAKARHISSQLDRIKCVSILGECERDIQRATTSIEEEQADTVQRLVQEVHHLESLLIELQHIRNDLFAMKVRTTVVNDDNEDYNDMDDGTCVKKESIKRSFEIEPDILSYSDSLNHRRKSDRTNVFRPISIKKNTNDEQQNYVKDAELIKEIVESRKKWEKLDAEYRKHAERIVKQKTPKEKTDKHLTPTPPAAAATISTSVDTTSSSRIRLVCPSVPFKINFHKISWKEVLTARRRAFHIDVKYLNRVIQDFVNMFKRIISRSKIHRFFKKRCLTLDIFLMRKTDLLRSRLKYGPYGL